jgi:UDP-glucose:(heptosyl)LPS alpha-1,3-glucosyltransferase
MTKRRLSLANNLVLVIEKLQMRFSGQIIANSHLVQDWLFEAFPHLNQHRVTVIYNQPDLNRFAPCTLSQKQSARVKWDIPPDTQVIATAGTNFMLKGIRPLIATLTHLPEDTLLVVAGGRHPGRYIRYAQRCGVAHRVRFVGRVDDMISFYQASDLFVLLSFYDACSNAVLEALASGLPVVSTTTNGSSFFLPPEWTVDPGTDPSQLAQKMKRILAQNKPSSFTFPDHVPSGLDPYIAAVKASLTLKKTAGSIGSNDS